MNQEGEIINMQTKLEPEKPDSNNKNNLSFWQKIKNIFSKIKNFFKGLYYRTKNYFLHTYKYVSQQNKTKAVRRQLVVWTASGILGIFLVIIIVFGIGIYRFNWQDGFTNKLVKYIPYPAAVSGSSWITVYEFRQEYNLVENFHESEGTKIEDIESIKNLVMNQLIEQHILKNEASKYGISVSDEEVNEQYDKLIETNGGEDQVVKTLKDVYGISKYQFKEMIGKQLLISKMMSDLPLKVKAQHIFFKDASAKGDSKIKANAERILKAIKEKPESFDGNAKKYSQDKNTKDKKGDLGWIATGQVVVCSKNSPEFDEAMLNMAVGDVELLKSKCGWHILKINEKEGWISKTYTKWLEEQKAKTKVWKFIK